MSDRLLLIDDDMVLLSEMAELLSGEGYSVDTASSGTMALEKIDASGFDIVFTDLMMPEMDGITLLGEIKDRRPDIFVVVITGFATVDTAVEAMKLGAFDYIKKPFKVEQLKDILNSIAKKREFDTKIDSISSSGAPGNETGSAYEQFMISRKGREALIMTPDPDRFRELDHVRIIKVSPLKQEEVISPRNIYKLKETIRGFLHDISNPLVFLDCLHEVMMMHEPQAVMDFVTKVADDVLQEDGQLLLSIQEIDTGSEAFPELKRIVSRTYIQVMSDSLSNPIRRDIVRFLKHNTESNFSAILNYLKKVESAKLSFHLQKLISDSIIGKNEKKQYFLSRRGKKAFDVIVSMEDEGVKDRHNLVTLRYRSAPS